MYINVDLVKSKNNGIQRWYYKNKGDGFHFKDRYELHKHKRHGVEKHLI